MHFIATTNARTGQTVWFRTSAITAIEARANGGATIHVGDSSTMVNEDADKLAQSIVEIPGHNVDSGRLGW